MPEDLLEAEEVVKTEVPEPPAAPTAKEDLPPAQATEVTKRTGAGKPPEPKKTIKDAPPPPTPNPPFKSYWSESPNRLQYPNQLLNWCREIPTWAQNRLMFYIYRDWPVLLRIEPEMKKAAKDAGLDPDDNYIDKLAKPFNDIQELLDRYGSGDYHVLVIDDVVEKRILATIWVREHWREFRSHPPTDKRIDDTKNIVMEEKTNASYIAFLRSKGKLPDQIKQEVNMAEAKTVDGALGLLGKFVDNALESKKETPDGNMSTVVGEIVNVMGGAYKQIQENLPKPVDPIENFSKIATLMKELQPATREDGSSGMMAMFMTMITENNKAAAESNRMIMQMQESRISDLKEIVTALRPSTPAPPAPGTPGAPPPSAKDVLKDVLEMSTLLGLRRGPTTSAVSDSGPMDWKSMLPDILESGSKIIGSLIQGYQIKTLADARAANPNAPIVMQAPTPMQQQNQNQNPSQPQIQNGTPVPAEAEGVDGSESDDLVGFLSFIEKPFINHFLNGWGGDGFAEWFIAGTDHATYDQVRGMGAGTITTILKAHAPIAAVVAGKDMMLQQFVEEFLKDPDEGEGESGGEGEGEGGNEGEDAGDPGEVYEPQTQVVMESLTMPPTPAPSIVRPGPVRTIKPKPVVPQV
jgi:hypothetical protein